MFHVSRRAKNETIMTVLHAEISCRYAACD